MGLCGVACGECMACGSLQLLPPKGVWGGDHDLVASLP
ncbi:unnamed protein product [Camellia sinensis]